MPRLPTSGADEESSSASSAEVGADSSGSVPPPAPRATSATAPGPLEDKVPLQSAGDLSPEETEALARVAALAATRTEGREPSQAMRTTLVVLVTLVVALLLLAAVVAIGPDAGTAS